MKACKVLGVNSTAPLADVKKRYGDLAKAHHPDVCTTPHVSSTSRMTDINTAYNTVKQFYQAGRKMPAPSSGRSGGYWGESSGSASSSGGGTNSSASSSYQPWHDDIDPLMYEMMWEEMRRQNDEQAFHSTPFPGAFYRAGGPWHEPRSHQKTPSGPPHRNAKQSNQQQQQRRTGSKGSGDSPASQKPRAKTTTWPEADVKAMVHMYQDGKSFEFIANALGKKTTAEVVLEFNRWSEDQQQNNNNHTKRQKKSNSQRRNGRPRYANGRGPMYYSESPDEIPFELYHMMEEEDNGFYDHDGYDDGNPYGYYTEDMDGAEEDMGGIPFCGSHMMSGGAPLYGKAHQQGGPQKRQRTYNSSRNASYHPPRNHRGNPPK